MISDEAGPDDSGQDSLETALDDIVRAAELMIDHLGVSVVRGRGSVTDVESEIIEGVDEVTVIVEAPGYSKRDIRARVEGLEFVLEGPDFSSKASLPCRVDPEGLEVDYRNGIVSIVAKKSG